MNPSSRSTAHRTRRGAKRTAVATATPVATALLSLAVAGTAIAQTPPAPPPPKAQAWIDVATGNGQGMPGFGGGGGLPSLGGALGGALGGLFGGGQARNEFGRTTVPPAGRWVDVTLMVRGETLSEAQQQVPAGFLPQPLKLVAPPPDKVRPVPDSDDTPIEPSTERPKGKLLLYWGCGATVRQGQPRVLDFATMSPQDAARFFVARSALRRGAHAQPGRPIWPNPQDTRLVPASASLVGEHRYTGAGLPDGFAFQLPPSVDLMPPLNLQHQDAAGATDLRWTAAPTAKAYFVAAMGAAAQDQMVLWTSSEVAETGFGLVDYQAPGAIDGWLREKVLLPASTTSCTIPKGVFPQGSGGMVRMIGYGPQLNLVHPPRPADRNAKWEPVWAVQVRTKTTDGAILGMPSMATMGGTETGTAEAPPPAEQPKRPGAVDVLRGILGR